MRIKIILAVFFFFTTLTFNVESSVFPPDLLSDNGYLLDEASPPGLVTGLLEIPNTVSTMLIGFQFLNVGDGDWLSVHIGDRLVFTIDGNDINNSLELHYSFIDISEFAGTRDSLTFILNTVGQPNAQIVVNERVIFFTPSGFRIDEQNVVRNGTQLFKDSFDDGSPPPSAPNFSTGAEASYTVNGNFSNESNGKLELNVADGVDTLTPTGRPARIQSARLQTSTNPDSARNLGTDDTFVISAIYDLILPGTNSEAFRLGVTDRTQPQGPGDTTNDVVRVSVNRSERDRPECRDPVTQVPVGAARGEVVITLSSLDFVEDTSTTLDCYKIDLSGNPDQIRMTLAKLNPASSEITASFTYLKYGLELSATNFLATDTIFSGGVLPGGAPFAAEAHTRPQFDTFFIPGIPTPEIGIELSTGSPVSISQNVNTPLQPFTFDFFYQFKTTTGLLTVSLGGIDLLMISAPSTFNPNFQKASVRIDNTALLDATGLDLQFLLDGSTGSTVVLDNILFPGLINGDFQSGNLTQWNVSTTGTGSIGIAQVASLVPMDIKPETCPNDFNTGKKGSFPVAILGMEHFDVSNVDVSSIRLQGVTPTRSSVKDVSSIFEPFGGKQDSQDCTTLGADGFGDLIVQFDAQQVAATLGAVDNGAIVALNLTATLLDGTPIRGEDVMVIKKK